MGVSVRTNGDSSASLDNGMVLVELTKDGDSPNCPRSWTYGVWIDGTYIDGTYDEASLASTVKYAADSIAEISRALKEMSDYLFAYGTFYSEPGEAEE